MRTSPNVSSMENYCPIYTKIQESPEERFERKRTSMRRMQSFYDFLMFLFLFTSLAAVIGSSIFGNQNGIVFSSLFFSTLGIYSFSVFFVRRVKSMHCLSSVGAVQIVCLLENDEYSNLQFYEMLEYDVYYDLTCGHQDDYDHDHDHCCCVKLFTRGNVSVLLIWILSLVFISLMILATHHHDDGGFILFLMGSVCAVVFLSLWTLVISFWTSIGGKLIPEKFIRLSLLQDIGFVSRQNMQKLKVLLERHLHYKNVLTTLTESLTKKELESESSLSEKINNLKEEHRKLKKEEFVEWQQEIKDNLPIIDFSTLV